MPLIDADGKPHLHALVAYWSDVFGLCSEPRVMPLEDAEEYHRCCPCARRADGIRSGFAVLVDPDDEADLARWEQLQRVAPLRKWFEGSF